jgi:hypothetical protein
MTWFNLLQKFEYTGEQRAGVGTTFYYEEKSSGQLMKLHYKVTEWAENRKIAFGGDIRLAEEGRPGVEHRDHPEGSRFTMFEDLEMPMGILGKIIGALFGQMMIGGNMNRILANLKKCAEA